MTRIRDNGTVMVLNVRFQISRTLAGATAHIVEENTTSDHVCAGTVLGAPG
jgi:hypothetical protein